jgi:dTDP-4-amino-4,6-dideoxygalactose transaminase
MIAECEKFLEKECGGKVFMMPSCTAALELACMMILEPGDEVIMPSWTFPSCANAVILRGGIPVFVDVDENLNMDMGMALDAITSKTKAFMPIHYAGVVCDTTVLVESGIHVIEDAAQAIGNWKVSGDFGCLSFHYTKNVQCGQGGALVVNNPEFIEKAEIMMHCGTTKAKFYRGETEGYDWVDVGSQYVMSEHQARALLKNLLRLDEITSYRRSIWNIYDDEFINGYCFPIGNGHLYWWFEKNKWDYIRKMRECGIKISSHYDALHCTVPGEKYGRRAGRCENSLEAMRLLVKLDTSVTEEEARRACEVLWGNDTIHNIL